MIVFTLDGLALLLERERESNTIGLSVEKNNLVNSIFSIVKMLVIKGLKLVSGTENSIENI